MDQVDEASESSPSRCALCGSTLPPHGFYIIRIDVFAEPSLPPTSSAELASGDFDAQMLKLMQQMSSMSADDLQDQVHRRFEYQVCATCQKAFLINPLGQPRRAAVGWN